MDTGFVVRIGAGYTGLVAVLALLTSLRLPEDVRMVSGSLVLLAVVALWTVPPASHARRVPAPWVPRVFVDAAMAHAVGFTLGAAALPMLETLLAPAPRGGLTIEAPWVFDPGYGDLVRWMLVYALAAASWGLAAGAVARSLSGPTSDAPHLRLRFSGRRPVPPATER